MPSEKYFQFPMFLTIFAYDKNQPEWLKTDLIYCPSLRKVLKAEARVLQCCEEEGSKFQKKFGILKLRIKVKYQHQHYLEIKIKNEVCI